MKENPPLVLLHGWGFSSTVWRPLMQALHAAGHDAVYPLDLPGFGTAFHEPSRTLDDVLDYIVEQLPEQSVLCGWSLGGMLAMQVAARWPEKIAGIITLGSNLFFTADGTWPGMPRADYEQFCQRFAAQPEKTWQRFLRLQTKGEPDAERSAAIVAMSADYSAINPATATNMLALLGAIDNRTLLGTLSVPGLHVLGENDAITPVAVAHQLRNMSPAQQHIQVLPNSSHAMPVLQTPALASAIHAFLLGKDPAVDKHRIAQSFSRAAALYDNAAKLQRDVGAALLATLPENMAGIAVDIGCGTGFITGALHQKNAGVVSIDIAAGMLQRTQQLYPAARCVQADMEQLPFAHDSVDWLISNLALQWASDTTVCLQEWRRVLNTGGKILFSTFLPGTLCELEQSWRAVDNAVHVNRFVAEPVLSGSLQSAGFTQIETVRATHTLYYPQLRDLARELKAIGAHNMNAGQPRGLTGRARWQKLQAHYETLRTPRGLPATYEVLYVVAS